jgi:YcxB-like protein
VGGFYLLVLFAMSLGVAALVSQGDRSWLMGLMGMAIGMGYLMLLCLYVIHLKNSMAKLRDMGSPNATFRADEQSFTLESGIGTSTLQWSTVKELWKFQNVWLLMFTKAHFSTLPVANLPADLQAFILERVQLAGGKIQ